MLPAISVNKNAVSSDHAGCGEENEFSSRQAGIHVGRSETGPCKRAGERMLQAWSRVMTARMDEHEEALEILRK